ALDNRQRYQLLTSLVVPRPIGWIGTWGADRVPNLAPFSYFAALSPTPMLVGVSIGRRREGPKDSLVNVRATGAFSVNVVTEGQLEAMNQTAASHPPGVDEFREAGLSLAEATAVDAPYVEDCPAVFACRLHKEVDLGVEGAALVIGEVMAVRLSSELEMVDDSCYVDSTSLKPVGRLWGSRYGLLGEIIDLPRP
ncbi:MAG: flavin reductase family protein, partial [Gammaproteobacteria bacterium]|nr:flavin reductase family protein [Gammaproteobacteria bacterium]